MLSSSRNQRGLDSRKIAICEAIWELLGGNDVCPLDISEASVHGSRTRFNQSHNVVYLGADVEPGIGMEARVRMAELACLTHELAHAERFRKGYDRPIEMPDILLDEAEASLDASFSTVISQTERHDLVEDAQNQLIRWLDVHSDVHSKGRKDAN